MRIVRIPKKLFLNFFRMTKQGHGVSFYVNSSLLQKKGYKPIRGTRSKVCPFKHTSRVQDKYQTYYKVARHKPKTRTEQKKLIAFGQYSSENEAALIGAIVEKHAFVDFNDLEGLKLFVKKLQESESNNVCMAIIPNFVEDATQPVLSVQSVTDNSDNDEEEIQEVVDGMPDADDIQSGHTLAAPAWVNRACELLVKNKIQIAMVALQVRRVAQKNAESVDITGFDILLELKEERCLDVERIMELQDELNL